MLKPILEIWLSRVIFFTKIHCICWNHIFSDQKVVKICPQNITTGDTYYLFSLTLIYYSIAQIILFFRNAEIFFQKILQKRKKSSVKERIFWNIKEYSNFWNETFKID
jgi:hypothetical protein